MIRGGFYVLDIESGDVEEIGRIRPWLDNNILAQSRSFRVASTDGIEVTAFLTLPPRMKGTPPLVVMPHGGPIGVADQLTYNTDVQYLARMGYAILRVNYRGSGGRGTRFEKAGNRQWGRGIEDDIEAAIDQVVSSGLVDGDRICTHGASYGGYSALMLVVRRPEAYRCASSLMGVSDIALMFNNDDVFLGERLVEGMKERVGNPDEDYVEQVEYSPAYNAEKIRIPVLLAHGRWDRRVDWDHLVRMKIALELEGTPVRTIELARTGHGFARSQDRIRYFKALREFLLEHIGR
ncbi:MAG: prolyl oligopeptidase family serine peptidase [bacterium]|nr:prolyl oligopeptidase family serine peptidase [bacterium]